MYVVKIGNLHKITQKSMEKPLFFPLFTGFDFVVFYQPISVNGGWSKIYIRKSNLLFHQNPYMEVIQKWHRKSSLWRLSCVTLTSL